MIGRHARLILAGAAALVFGACAGTPVRQPAQATGPEADVRAAIATFASRQADISSIDAAAAHVAISDTVATAEPVVMRNRRSGSAEYRLTLHRGESGWYVRTAEFLAPIPVELEPGGPGAEYLALTERWAGANLTWIQRTLWANPPNGGDSTLRAHALLALDEPLHLRSAPSLRPVQEFLRANIDHAIAQMRAERVTEGATIWKLYNHGWIARTANHTWAHDLNDGAGRASMSDQQIDALLSEIDVLFLSHWHGDHVAMNVVQRALAKGIPVLLPPVSESEDGARARERVVAALGPGATVIAPGSHGETRGLRWHAYPGHQGDMPNNVYAVTADGMTIMQTGDQADRNDFAWIDSVGAWQAVDVLLPNVWTIEMRRVVAGVRPRFVFPGHENELGHNFEHREPYCQAYEVLDGIPAKWYVLAWGERVHVDPR